MWARIHIHSHMQLRPHSITVGFFLVAGTMRQAVSQRYRPYIGAITVLRGTTEALGSVVQQARSTMLMWVDPEGREAKMCQERSRAPEKCSCAVGSVLCDKRR